MKGIVFTEFLELAETQVGPEAVERIIDASDLSTGGAYTTVGTYSHTELLRLVTQLSAVAEVPASDLVRAFGKHLFRRFLSIYPQFFDEHDSVFSFLTRVDEYIHLEVRKLYPDAELPRIRCVTLAEDCLEVVYSSTRPFVELAHGLLDGCIEHFGERVELVRQSDIEGRDTNATFVLTRLAGVVPCNTLSY